MTTLNDVSLNLRPGWHLIDSAKRATTYPRTWQHPTPEILALIQPNFYVKIGLESDNPVEAGERFWGRVLSIDNNHLKIIITQDLVYNHGLNDRDILIVQLNHIFGILRADGTPVWIA